MHKDVTQNVNYNRGQLGKTKYLPKQNDSMNYDTLLKQIRHK